MSGSHAWALNAAGLILIGVFERIHQHIIVGVVYAKVPTNGVQEQGTNTMKSKEPPYTNSIRAGEPRDQQKSKGPLNTNGGGGASQAPGVPHRGPLRPMVTRDVLAFFKISQKVLILAFLENALQRSKSENMFYYLLTLVHAKHCSPKISLSPWLRITILILFLDNHSFFAL